LEEASNQIVGPRPYRQGNHPGQKRFVHLGGVAARAPQLDAPGQVGGRTESISRREVRKAQRDAKNGQPDRQRVEDGPKGQFQDSAIDERGQPGK